jgi:hypothetical protein
MGYTSIFVFEVTGIRAGHAPVLLGIHHRYIRYARYLFSAGSLPSWSLRTMMFKWDLALPDRLKQFE